MNRPGKLLEVGEGGDLFLCGKWRAEELLFSRIIKKGAGSLLFCHILSKLSA